MNGLVPALLAVLLAEIGQRTCLYGRGAGQLAQAAIAVAVVIAAVAGALVAPLLASSAEALVIAVAVGFAGLGQLQRVATPSGTVAGVLGFLGGSTGLLVFALATRFEAVSVAFGALAGLAAAVVVTPLVAVDDVLSLGFRVVIAVGLAAVAVLIAAVALNLI